MIGLRGLPKLIHSTKLVGIVGRHNTRNQFGLAETGLAGRSTFGEREVMQWRPT
jgi:hypothetical protein